MNTFSSLNPVFILIILILGYLTFLVLFPSHYADNYLYFNNFFCSGWAGDCIPK